MSESERFVAQNRELSRRFFLRCGVAGAVAGSTVATSAADLPAELTPALEKLESYFTPPDQFGDVSRGNPIPHSLPEEKKKAAGLTRETWKLEVLADPDNPATLGHPL